MLENTTYRWETILVVVLAGSDQSLYEIEGGINGEKVKEKEARLEKATHQNVDEEEVMTLGGDEKIVE
ncbi:hypothetical protein V6N11_030879 [Hibiscus sabdariffa]|uniref:Uncharacterized protein n=2 Tax=Hibiscus sabdariffa TaxID=183260 RepID=A0ABR1ZDR9_9ROSI